MAPATCMIRVCTYARTVIDVSFFVLYGISPFNFLWSGRQLGRLVGRWAVCLHGWLVIRLTAWTAGWWSGCQRGRLAGSQAVCL